MMQGALPPGPPKKDCAFIGYAYLALSFAGVLQGFADGV